MAGKKYSESEDNLIRKYYPFMTSRQVSKIINRTEHSVSHRAERLNVKKSKSFYDKETKVVELFITQTFYIYESKLNFMF